MAHDQVYSIQEALESLDNDRPLFATIVRAFIDDVPRQQIKLSSAVQYRDRHGLEKTAHAIKSAAATVGAQHTSQQGKDLESDAMQAPWEELQPRVQQLKDGLQELVSLLGPFAQET